VVKSFRASIVLEHQDLEKSYAIINNYIKQHIEKVFMYIYDFKFDDLSTIKTMFTKTLDKYTVNQNSILSTLTILAEVIVAIPSIQIL
jgi:hypothetical protein